MQTETLSNVLLESFDAFRHDIIIDKPLALIFEASPQDFNEVHFCRNKVVERKIVNLFIPLLKQVSDNFI